MEAVWLLCLPRWEAETNVEHLLALNNSAEFWLSPGEGTWPSAGLAVASLTVWKTGLSSQEVALSYGPGSV